MSEFSAQIDSLIGKADNLEHGSLQIATLQEAVRLADNSNDAERGCKARMSLCYAATFSGHPELALIAFSWCLAQFDRNPTGFPFSEWDVLWKYKWILGSLTNFPDITRDQIMEALEDFCRRLHQAGYGKRTEFDYRRRIALGLCDNQSAENYHYEWLKHSRDAMSNCPACECDEHVRQLLVMGKEREALQLAEPLLNERMRCAHPPSALANALCPLVRAGRADEAARTHLQSYRHFANKLQYVAHVGEHLEYLFLISELPKALDIFERHLLLAVETPNVANRRHFYFKALPLIRMLQQKDGNIPIQLPCALHQKPELGRPANMWSLFQWLEKQCWDLAAQFDRRNGNDLYQRELHERTAEEERRISLNRPLARIREHPHAVQTASLHRADADEQSKKAQQTGAGKLVFVVDDEQGVREIYRYLLEVEGYTVETFENREIAWQSFLKADPRPDLLITDYDGFPISAEELMQRCRRVQPRIKILMASGYPKEDVLRRATVLPDRLLVKGNEMDKLLEEVTSLV